MSDTLRKEVSKYRRPDESQAGCVRRLATVNGQLFDRIESLTADVAKWRLEVEATANRGQALLGRAELDRRAADERVAVRLGELRLAKEDTDRALRVADGQIATVRAELAATKAELAKAKEWAVRAELAYTDERRASARQEGIHAAKLAEANRYGRLVGSILGAASVLSLAAFVALVLG